MQTRGSAVATFFAGVIRVFEQMTDALDFHGRALQLRASRQETISSNIANADTPNFKARDFDFGAALREANGMAPADSGMREALPAAEAGCRRWPWHGRTGGIGPWAWVRCTTGSPS